MSASSNYRLLKPYILPYAAYVVIASLFSSLAPEWNYLIRILVVSITLYWAWRWYIPFCGPKNCVLSIITGILIGLIGTVLWVALLLPFVEPSAKEWETQPFLARMIASTLLVPIFEELFMRVYVFRIAHQWYIERRKHQTRPFGKVFHEQSLNDFKPGEWSYFAIIFSTAAFAIGHQVIAWPTAILYGFLMSGLWIIRKDIMSCIIAHATTNFTLGIYIYFTGRWNLW